MDYHSLPRKQLQALCKKHDIPANQTNVQMADALTTLLKAEGKPKSDANAGRMQNVRVESGKENSNVPKAYTRSNKEPVKSGEEGVCEEHVASVENVESNEGVKVGKTRGRGLPKLVPENKEPKEEIDGNTKKHLRGSQRERTCKNSVSDFSTVDVTSKKVDKKKTSATEHEAVREKATENIEGHQSLRVEETLKDEENHGKHLRHSRKKTMPEQQIKPKVVDVGTKGTKADKATHHPEVATDLSVKDVDGEQKNVTNKVPVIIDIVDSDDEEAVNDVKDKADIVHVSVESTMNLSESLEPVITVNASKSPKRVVTRKGHKGGHKKEEVLKTGSEEDKVNAVCTSVEPASNSSECLKKAATLRGKKEEKEMTAHFKEGKFDTVHVSNEPPVKQRGQKGGKKEKLIVTNSIEEAQNIVTDVPVETTLNDSGSPKREITRKGCNAEHKKKMLQTSSEEDKVDVVFVSAEPTSSSLKSLRQIVTRRGQKSSHKEEMLTNASSEEDKIDVVNVSDEPALNQRGRKGGKKGELMVTNSVEEAKNIVTDVPVEAIVHASESPKRVVTRKGRKGEQKKEVLKTGSEEDKFNAVCVSVEPASTSVECLKQVMSRRGQKYIHTEEKMMNASSQEDKIDVINSPDEPAVNQRGRKGCKKGELIVTNSIEEAKNTITDVPVESTVNVSESSKGVVTRKSRKGEHKEDLKTGSEEDKFNAVCVSNEPMSTSLQCLKQVVIRRGHKSSHKEEKAVNASSEDILDVPAVNRRGRHGGQKKESGATKSSQEVKNIGNDAPLEVTVNVSKSTKQVVTRKGCKSEHKKGEVLKANVELTLNSSESPKQAITQRGVKCGELLVNDTIKESKNDATDISVEDNVSASESPERLVTRQGCKTVHEKVLDATAEESKTNAVSIPVKPTVKCSETPKHVVTRRGRINKQEGRKVVTVISPECPTPAVAPRVGKSSQKLLVTDSIEEVKHNATDISVEDNANASQSPKKVITQEESNVGNEKVVNAIAKVSNVDLVNLNENCSKTPKHVFTRRGRINRQEEVLETDCVEEAKNNTTDIPVEASLNFEDDAAVQATENTSLEHVTHEGYKSWFKEDLVNAIPEENKVDASGMSDESIQGQGESSEGGEAKAGEIVLKFVDTNSQSSSACEVDIDSVVNEEDAYDLRDSSSCEEEDLNDVKEIELCLNQDVEISEQTASHGDSANDQEGGNIDVDNLSESLDSIEEKINQPHGDFAHEQEYGDVKMKPDKVDVSLNLVAKDEALEEQTLESLEKDSNLLCEAGLESAIDEEDPRELRDSSSCKEDKLNDVMEKEISPIQDLEMSQERAAYADSFNDQEDGDFEKNSEKVYSSVDSAAKDEDALEEQTEVGDGMIAASTVFVDNILEKESNLSCEVDIDSAVKDEGAHEIKDSSSCKEEDLNDAKEKELCLIQVVEISQQKALHGDSTSDQEGGDFNVDTLNEALQLIEEKTNQPHGDSADDQEDADFEKEPDNVYTCSDLATEDDKASGEQTMARSIVFIDNMLDESLESAEKDSNLPCEACLDSANAVSEEDAHKSSDSSTSEEDNFNAKEDGTFEEKSERLYTGLDLAEKHDDALEKQTTAGVGMIARSTVYVDNILDKSVESPEKDSNLPCEFDIDSAVYEEAAHELKDSCFCEEENLNDVMEKELVEISEQKGSHGDSASDQKDGDFAKKSEKASNSLSLTAKDDDTMEEQTIVADAMITGSTVFADNILENSVELLEKYSNLQCEVGVVSAVNEESAQKLVDFRSSEEGNFNSLGKELYLIEDLERSQQKISYDDSASVQENGDFEMKSEKLNTNLDLAAEDHEASEGKIMASKGRIAGKIVFVDNTLAESVESKDKFFNLQFEAGVDVAINEDVHESRNSGSSEEDDCNNVNEKELNLIGGVDITHDEYEDSGECHSGEVSVGKDGPENLLSYVIEEASLSTTPSKKIEHAGSSNISYFSGINDSAVEERLESLPTDCQSDASMKISGLIERCTELCSPLKKTESTSNTTVSPSLGMDDSVNEESVDFTELANPEEMPEFTKGQLSPHLSSLFDEDSHSKKSELRGMDDYVSEWSQEDCMEEDCNLGVPETDAPLKTLVIEKGRKESLSLDTLLEEGSPVKKCELIHSNVVPHSVTDDSVIKQSEVRSSTEAGEIELSEFDALPKIYDCTEDNEFSFSPCLNIFDTPLKNPVLQSITGMPTSSGMKEDCDQGVPEIDSPSKMLVLEKGHDECLFLDTLFGEGTPLKKCMDHSAIEQSEVNPGTGACKMELFEFNCPSQISDATKDDDFSFSPRLNIFDTPSKDTVLQCITDMPICSGGHSDIEQSSKILTKKASKLNNHDLQASSDVPEHINDQDISPFLNILSVKDIGSSLNNCEIKGSGDISACSAVVHSVTHKVQEVLPTEASKIEFSQIDDSYVDKSGDKSPFLNTSFVDKIVSPLKNFEVEHTSSAGVSCCGIDDYARNQSGDVLSKMAENTKDRDRSPCLETLFVDDKPLSSGINDSDRDQSGDVLSKMAENTENHVRSPCIETLFVDDKWPLSSGIDNSARDQSADVLSKMVVNTEKHDRSPCFETLFVDDKSLSSGIDDSARDQSGDVLSKMAENTEYHGRSPCLETLFGDDKPLSSGMDNSSADQTMDGLPTEACRQELAQLDASSKMSEVTKDQDRSLDSNIVFLEGIGGTDSGLLKMLEIHRTEDSKLQMALMRQGSSTSSERSKLAGIDGLLQCADIDNYVPEQGSEILPIEASKLQCCQSDSHLKMVEPTKGHDNASFQSRQAVDSDLDKLSLRHLRRLYKEKQMKRKKSGKVIRKKPALQDLSSNVFGEESQQDSKTQLERNIVTDVNKTSRKPVLTEASGKLDKPEEFHQKSPEEIRLPQLISENDHDSLPVSPTAGTMISENVFGESQQDCETYLHRNNDVSQVNITSKSTEPELAEDDSLHASPAVETIISEYMFGEYLQDCKTDIHCNNDVSDVNIASAEPELAEDDSLHVSPAAGTIVESQEDRKTELHCNNDVSQVNIASTEPELAEGSEEFRTGSNYVLPQTSAVEIGLPEVTSSYRVSIDDSILDQDQEICKTDLGFNSQPSEVYSTMSKPELAVACNKSDKLHEDCTSLKKSKDTGDHDLVCESPASRIITSETVYADERNGLALEENPFVPNNSVESGLLFEEHTVCKEESRIPKLVDRLKILNDRILSMQSNLQGLAPESTYATPLRKAMNCRSIGSAKKNRVPMSVGRSSMTCTKENPTDRRTPLSLKKDQRSYNENQFKSKDSDKVSGKRTALRNLSLNVLEERDQTTLHIHEED